MTPIPPKPEGPDPREYLHHPRQALKAKTKRILWEIVRSYTAVGAVRWLLLGLLMGVLSGLAAICFFYVLDLLKHFWLTGLAGLSLPVPAGEALHGSEMAEGIRRAWVVPILTTGVGLFTGYLVSRYIPESVDGGTDGTDATIKAFHQQGGVIRPRTPLIKGSTSVLTISAGGSAGSEGPVTQIGAGIGSWLALKFKLSAKERRILLLAGAAGGLGAIFRAPLGAAITAIEVVYVEDFEAEAVLPAVLSSVVAYSLFTLVFGHQPMFLVPDFEFRDLREIPFYVILAFFCACMGWIYVRTFTFFKYSVFRRLQLKLGLMWATGLGGLGMGLLGWAFPQLLSGGYGWMEMAILGKLGIGAMLLIGLGKILATSMTIGSGMSGGMFAPALFVGGMSGGVVGYTAHALFPSVVTQPGGYVLVGMAAFFAGVASAPIGPLLMVCELTKGYGLLAPLMLASALCLVLNRRVSLYENQCNNKFESPAHAADATINVLEHMQVNQAYQRERGTVLEESITLKALTDIITGTNEFNFPVVNTKGVFTGILTLQDARKVLFEDVLYDVVLVKDLMRPPVYVRLDYDLYSALMRFVGTDLIQIPVLDENSAIVGRITREDVFRAYSETIKSLHEEDR
jgi:chloride channel protein, CIC family